METLIGSRIRSCSSRCRFSGCRGSFTKPFAVNVCDCKTRTLLTYSDRIRELTSEQVATKYTKIHRKCVTGILIQYRLVYKSYGCHIGRAPAVQRRLAGEDNGIHACVSFRVRQEILNLRSCGINTCCNGSDTTGRYMYILG
jgi:hypothetical protein